MKKLMTIALAFMVSASFTTAQAASKKKKDKKQPAVEQAVPVVRLATAADSLSYAFGMSMGGQLKQMEIAGLNPDLLNLGARQVLTGDSTFVSDAVANSLLQHFFQQKQEEMRRKQEELAKQQREAGEKFLAENKLKEGIITTASGLQYKIIEQGNGAVPQATDKVQVHYEGRLIDGTVFDASRKHGDKPLTFKANQVIKGWTEALTMMPVGSKWQLFIPQELAYGPRPAGQIPPYSALIFDVELIGIEQ